MRASRSPVARLRRPSRASHAMEVSLPALPRQFRPWLWMGVISSPVLLSPRPPGPTSPCRAPSPVRLVAGFARATGDVVSGVRLPPLLLPPRPLHSCGPPRRCRSLLVAASRSLSAAFFLVRSSSTNARKASARLLTRLHHSSGDVRQR